jgi:hypothetical protein
VLWTDLQENLDRVPHERVLKLTQITLQRFPTTQLSPWPGSGTAPAKSRQAGGAPGRACDLAPPGAHLGALGAGVEAEGTAGEVDRRRAAAVVAMARGKRRGGRRFGQHANWGGSLGASEAIGVAGRRRARADARAQGGGGNGAVELGVARGGGKRRGLNRRSSTA